MSAEPYVIQRGWDTMLKALREWDKRRNPESYKARFERSTAGRRLRNRGKK